MTWDPRYVPWPCQSPSCVTKIFADQCILCSKIWTFLQIFLGKRSFCALSTEPTHSFTHNSPSFKAGSYTWLSHQRQVFYFEFILATVYVCSCVLKVTILGWAISPNNLRTWSIPCWMVAELPLTPWKQDQALNLLHKAWMHLFSS